MIHVGFTGTRRGMTPAQFDAVASFIARWSTIDALTCHHGDCVGADSQFHDLAVVVSRVVVHPPTDSRLRAFCRPAAEWRPARPYLARDRDIVDQSAVLVAAPREAVPRRHGGTWYTVGYAKRLRRSLVLVLPEGGGVRVEYLNVA